MNLSMQDFYSLSREERGKLMIDEGKNPRALNEEVFVIPSQFIKNKKYKVIHNQEGWFCDCPDYKYRGVECKHVFALRYWINLREYLNKEGIYGGMDKVIPSCIYCNSLKVVRNGKRKNKQRFKCESCNKTFIANPEFKGLKAEPKVVTLCLDLHLKGLSLRKIKDTVKQFYSVDVTHETIRNWKNKFMQQINDYVEEFKPEVSKEWHTDEMKVKTKKKWLWLWNTIDEETRFLIASNISNSREIIDAKKHFIEAKKSTDIEPNFVTTDGLQSYNKAFRKVFYTLRNPRTRHVRSIGFKENQLVERLHSTQKERIKVMRGLAHEKSLKFHQRDHTTYYNFVRPHQALNGLTPSEKAGINLNLKENKWISLIKKARH